MNDEEHQDHRHRQLPGTRNSPARRRSGPESRSGFAASGPDLLLESVVSVINLSARRIAKEDERDLEQVIEAVRALVGLLRRGARQAGARSPFQMLYAQHAEGASGLPARVKSRAVRGSLAETRPARILRLWTPPERPLVQTPGASRPSRNPPALSPPRRLRTERHDPKDEELDRLPDRLRRGGTASPGRGAAVIYGALVTPAAAGATHKGNDRMREISRAWRDPGLPDAPVHDHRRSHDDGAGDPDRHPARRRYGDRVRDWRDVLGCRRLRRQ